MAYNFESVRLAPTGSTGNNTHTAVLMPQDYEGLALEFEVTAIGATPTVTYKYQGSMDGVNFYDLAYITDANDTVAVATRTATTVSKQIAFLSNPLARNYRYIRLVTSANTNVTYRAEAWPI